MILKGENHGKKAKRNKKQNVVQHNIHCQLQVATPLQDQACSMSSTQRHDYTVKKWIVAITTKTQTKYPVNDK